MPHSNCSVCLPSTTSFSSRPIGTLETLARMLKHPVAQLEYIATTADQRYRIGKQERKKDESVRTCSNGIARTIAGSAASFRIFSNTIHPKLHNCVRLFGAFLALKRAGDCSPPSRHNSPPRQAPS